MWYMYNYTHNMYNIIHTTGAECNPILLIIYILTICVLMILNFLSCSYIINKQFAFCFNVENKNLNYIDMCNINFQVLSCSGPAEV